ncbi:MAG: pyridoxamine 5'-phosphate oxidase family protein [Dehalococcoidia bacterium]
MQFSHTVTTLEELRTFIPNPGEPAVRKQMAFLDEHCRSFIERSPFLFLATSNAAGDCDVSPKGDAPGFVHVLDEHTLVIPDRRGNQRADSLRNILDNPGVGLLFLIPGVEWTLRVNGRASIVRDDDVRERLAAGGTVPELALAVEVEEAFLHCPKCMLRAQLWDTDGWLPKDQHPPFAAILKDQLKYDVPVEVIQNALDADEKKLY